MLRPAHGMPLRACVLAFLTCLGAFAPAGAARAQDDFDAPPPEAMWEHVTVYRDDWGAPHVLADSVRAMAFGLGYAQAEDHIEPMLLAYRVAMGRASEILGPEHAASDAFSLRMGHGEMAEAAFRHADPITRDLCEGFALGVNMWLSDAGPAAPPWAEGVRPHEILALLHCYLMSHAPFDLYDRDKKAGIKLDKRKITIAEPIKNVGTYTVTCKLGYEISAPLTVKIEEA